MVVPNGVTFPNAAQEFQTFECRLASNSGIGERYPRRCLRLDHERYLMLPTPAKLRNSFSLNTMRLVVTASAVASLLAGLASPAAAQRDGRGDWRLDYNDTQQRVQLTFEDFDGRGGRTSTSFPVPFTSLEGLSISQLLGPTTPVRFRLRRDAGTFSFDGRAGSGWGRGVFDFRSDPQFRDQLARRGYERPDDEEQFQLALHDVGYALVDELKTQGYRRPSLGGLIKMGQHGARYDFVRGLAQLGYKLGDTDKLVELRDHGVTPTFITGLAEHGYSKLTADELVEMRDHGVTPAYISGLRTHGFSRLSSDQLIKLRDHGVTPSFVEGLSRLGHKGLSADQLVNARDHGVTPSFAEGFKQLGYSPSLGDLVWLRDHGVTVEFARRARERRGSNVPLDELVRMRDRGDSY